MRTNLSRLLLSAMCLVGIMVCRAQTYEYPFQNPKLSNEERVENLISLLTPEEKVGLMMNKSVSVDRLGIPSYNWWSEACHGVRQSGYTVYPQPIGMAASFNDKLFYDVFTTVSDEARANWNRSNHDIFNVKMGATYYPGNPELTFWCPNVNIFRDPRWGRGQESCGEDPYMNAVLGLQTVLGMQGNNDKYYKTHACAKHYAVHSGPEPLRHSMDVEVSMRDLWETYLPAFKKLVIDGNVREVMCAYHRYEGEPCCQSNRLLQVILRYKWKYDGIILTDCDAINNFFNKNQHGTHPDALSASVDAISNGTDLECGKAFMSLTDGLEKGVITEKDLDVHLRRTLLGRFELGMFDPADMIPWANLGEDVISSDSNHQLAVEAARQSMVLLKNGLWQTDKGLQPVLPLSKDIKKLAVVGPNADDANMLNGEYGGNPSKAHTHSLLDGIRAALPGTEIIYNQACELARDNKTTNYLGKFNDGKGIKAEFYSTNEYEGEPTIVKYLDNVRLSTFGAYGFAEGLPTDKFSVRLSGTLVSDFTGDMSYAVSSDNGYVLTVNGKEIENVKSASPRQGGFGRRGNTVYKTFPVEEGKSYDVTLEYHRGTGNFAMLSTEICQNRLVDFVDVTEAVKDAEAIIIIGGISPSMEGEGGDKADINLPAVQQRLLKAMHSTGKPVIFVNCSGSALAFGSLENQYDALIQAWYAGEGGSEALPEILFGDYNPSGKLPVTFYASNDDLPDFLDYSMNNRTYRYFRGTPQYAFGYGLSYTKFEYGQGKLSKSSMRKDGKVTVTVPVTNTGDREGEEIVQVYVKSLDNPDAPIKSLKGFARVKLAPGETEKAVITLNGESFEYYDSTIDELSVRPGKYQILYGSSSLDKDLKCLNFEVK